MTARRADASGGHRWVQAALLRRRARVSTVTAASRTAAVQRYWGAADNAQFVTEQRLQQGVDSKLNLTRSQLVAARIRLRIAEALGQADVLQALFGHKL